MSGVFDLSDRYVDDLAALDPIYASYRGIPGHDADLTDLSPEGVEARAELARRALRDLRDAPIESEVDRRGQAAMAGRLEAEIELVDSGEPYRELRIIASPMQFARAVFDLMPRESATDWENIATRLEKVPATLAGLVETFRYGLDRGLVAARRQASEAAEQAEAWGGRQPFFTNLVAGAPAGLPEALSQRLGRAARAATDAYAELGRFLRDEYAPKAPVGPEGVGADRYRLAARFWLGMDIDPVETYEWGWSELHRIDRAMAEVAGRIVPGGTVEDARARLESDPERAIEGEENLRAWLQDLMDATITELDGRHFDIAEPIKRVEAMIAPPGGPAAMYYTGPSEDLSRPGRTWYPTLGRTRFPLWGEVSIAYHEGVPGHHLQIAQVRLMGRSLPRFQRITMFGGYAEGWALYAERLMDELGYLSNPDYLFGQLRAQAMRAVRVILDIGLHLGLTVPTDQCWHPGEAWTPDLASAFAVERSHFPADFMASEVVRYLGWPAQAICYKVGERVWLEARDAVKRRHGAAFDLKSFHQAALDLGPMGLAELREELVRL